MVAGKQKKRESFFGCTIFLFGAIFFRLPTFKGLTVFRSAAL